MVKPDDSLTLTTLWYWWRRFLLILRILVVSFWVVIQLCLLFFCKSLSLHARNRNRLFSESLLFFCHSPVLILILKAYYWRETPLSLLDFQTKICLATEWCCPPFVRKCMAGRWVPAEVRQKNKLKKYRYLLAGSAYRVFKFPCSEF